jgi:hypothetical protein
MKLFDTLWDWLAREKREAQPASARATKAKAQGGRKPRAKRAVVAAQQFVQASMQARIQASAQTSTEAVSPAVSPVVSPVVSPRLVATPAASGAAAPTGTRVTKKEATALMRLPAASGSVPSVPEKLPRALRERYELVMRTHLEHYGIRVRKWRKTSSGIAWCIAYRSGRVQRLIESPRPLTPLSCAIFLHEVGHHAIGLGVHQPRCLEEYHAWMYSLRQMEAWGIEVSPRVQKRVQQSLRYAVRKAVRRGIRELPAELDAYR